MVVGYLSRKIFSVSSVFGLEMIFGRYLVADYRYFFSLSMNKSNTSVHTPPLNSLRMLVAVVRQGGVLRAAEKLHLTQGAVSHQIHTVQNALGMTLLEKRGRKLVPTRDAMVYVNKIEAAFQEIDVATQILLEGYHNARLHISTTPSFAAHWLLPRLGDFISSNPSLDIRVDSSSLLVDIQDGDADIAIRFGTGDYPGLFSELLLRDRIFPVCSPAYARRHKLARPSDLDGQTLLRSDGEPWSWWFPVAGIDADEPTHGLVFSDSSLMLQAAIDGQGVGLVRQSVGCEALAAGALIRPFTASAETPYSYYFVCRKDRIDIPSIACFRQWLSARIADYSARAENLE